ncbi:hypothetical protein INT48_006747 [Thamnidium elegans]|uniref:Mitochondrial import inner membrane translocase subunit TIM50 n=1 Tax=Thamnidium elegans TaxID=101142 RepID=A0A8H7VVL0_9FUNG|nr:hypothetical protein INT48_006747 [Thamnidium elegans]
MSIEQETIVEQHKVITKSKKICEQYLALSLQTSTRLPDKQRQLLILDLNGTLCSRTTAKTYFARPHAKAFFDYIFKNFTVMVWSSAQTFSVKKMCQMFQPYKPHAVWDRSHLGLSETEFYSNVDTIKDIKKVWQAFQEFNATNTIVLDDSASKLAIQPYNLIKMSTFDFQLFGTQTEGERDLLKVKKYLKELRYQSNVCNYIRNHPLNIEGDHGVKAHTVNDKLLISYVNGRILVPVGGGQQKKKKKRLSAKQKREAALLKSSEAAIHKPSESPKKKKKRKAKAISA